MYCCDLNHGDHNIYIYIYSTFLRNNLTLETTGLDWTGVEIKDSIFQKRQHFKSYFPLQRSIAAASHVHLSKKHFRFTDPLFPASYKNVSTSC